MNVQGFLDKIEDTIDMGSKIPLSGKVAVDADAIKQCVEDIRYDLPIELEKAQEVVAHHNNLITTLFRSSYHEGEQRGFVNRFFRTDGGGRHNQRRKGKGLRHCRNG